MRWEALNDTFIIHKMLALHLVPCTQRPGFITPTACCMPTTMHLPGSLALKPVNGALLQRNGSSRNRSQTFRRVFAVKEVIWTC